MLHELNPTVKIVPCSDYLDKASVERIVARPDVVIDCLDNFETRYLLNDYCVKQGIPFVHGAVHGLMGQVSFLHPPETPCLRCLFLDAPPKETFPIVGATAGIVGSIQAMEALKFLTGVGSVLKGQLLFIDGADMTVTTIDVKRAPSCPVCGSCV
jgi:adenylyltransferase/sulfurtransferase